MKKHVVIAAVAAVAATAPLLLAAGSASAATEHPVVYSASAAGTKISAVGGTVKSGSTAQSSLKGTKVPASKTNTVASGNVAGLLSTGAITTGENVTALEQGAQDEATSTTADVSLLNGLIGASAVTTNATISVSNNIKTADVSSNFSGLHVSILPIPVTIPTNFTLTVPGVAKVVLNFQDENTGNDTVNVSAAAIRVTLLSALGQYGVGTKVYVNPVSAKMTAHADNTPFPLGGSAYGTRIGVSAGSEVNIDSGRTAQIKLAAGGTKGNVRKNSTAGVNVPSILKAGAVTSTAKGITTKTHAYARTTSSVGGLKLFGGVITAKAIQARAELTFNQRGVLTDTSGSVLTDLVVAGQPIPVDAAPNTVINVAGLGTVTVNKQSSNSYSTTVEALRVRLSTAEAGLPAGAVLDLAVASANIIH